MAGKMTLRNPGNQTFEIRCKGRFVTNKGGDNGVIAAERESFAAVTTLSKKDSIELDDSDDLARSNHVY